MSSILEHLVDLRDPGAVIKAFRDGADANRSAACRKGSIDLIGAPARLIATGDLHDNPLHFARVVDAAGYNDAPSAELAHLTLHELIHSDRLINDMDFSYRVLARAAALKARFPEHVHTLLANHELAQIVGSGIVKDGLNVVNAFNDAVEHTFGSSTGDVAAAINSFIRSMPLALRCAWSLPAGWGSGEGGVGVHEGSTGGDVLCAHSLPAPEMMDRFDLGIFSRDLVEADYEPRRGSAHLLVWGRGHHPAQLSQLGEALGVRLFILGHEKAPTGWLQLSSNTVVLNSDHEFGVYLDMFSDQLARGAPGKVIHLSKSGT